MRGNKPNLHSTSVTYFPSKNTNYILCCPNAYHHSWQPPLPLWISRLYAGSSAKSTITTPANTNNNDGRGIRSPQLLSNEVASGLLIPSPVGPTNSRQRWQGETTCRAGLRVARAIIPFWLCFISAVKSASAVYSRAAGSRLLPIKKPVRKEPRDNINAAVAVGQKSKANGQELAVHLCARSCTGRIVRAALTHCRNQGAALVKQPPSISGDASRTPSISAIAGLWGKWMGWRPYN